MTDEAFERAKAGHHRSFMKQMMGTPSYDILANNTYQADFQYISVNNVNRSLYIIDEDTNEDNDSA